MQKSEGCRILEDLMNYQKASHDKQYNVRLQTDAEKCHTRCISQILMSFMATEKQ